MMRFRGQNRLEGKDYMSFILKKDLEQFQNEDKWANVTSGKKN